MKVLGKKSVEDLEDSWIRRIPKEDPEDIREGIARGIYEGVHEYILEAVSNRNKEVAPGEILGKVPV